MTNPDDPQAVFTEVAEETPTTYLMWDVDLSDLKVGDAVWWWGDSPNPHAAIVAVIYDWQRGKVLLSVHTHTGRGWKDAYAVYRPDRLPGTWSLRD